MHYHLTTSTPERVLALDEQYGTYLGALADARKLVVEALPRAGRIEYVPVTPHGDQREVETETVEREVETELATWSSPASPIDKQLLTQRVRERLART